MAMASHSFVCGDSGKPNIAQCQVGSHGLFFLIGISKSADRRQKRPLKMQIFLGDNIHDPGGLGPQSRVSPLGIGCILGRPGEPAKRRDATSPPATVLRARLTTHG